MMFRAMREPCPAILGMRVHQIPPHTAERRTPAAHRAVAGNGVPQLLPTRRGTTDSANTPGDRRPRFPRVLDRKLDQGEEIRTALLAAAETGKAHAHRVAHCAGRLLSRPGTAVGSPKQAHTAHARAHMAAQTAAWKPIENPWTLSSLPGSATRAACTAAPPAVLLGLLSSHMRSLLSIGPAACTRREMRWS